MSVGDFKEIMSQQVSVLVMANRKRTMRKVGFSTLRPGCFFDHGLEGAESAKRDEMPRSIYDGPLVSS